MKKGLVNSNKVFIIFSILSLAYVSLLSIVNPQTTMDMVQTQLPNNDAISSIRGIYGGVGLTIVVSLAYLFLNDFKKATLFLTIFWGSYAISRIITIIVNGPLGTFGNQWLIVESVLCTIALGLTLLNRKQLANE